MLARMSTPPAPTRRRFLLGAVSVPLVAYGCRPLVREPVTPPREDPDVVIARRVLAAEDSLLAAYVAAGRGHRRLAGALAPFRARHRAHRAALLGRLPRVPGTTPSFSTSPSGTVSPARTPASSVRRELHRLVRAERAAAAARVDDVLDAGPSLAELLASIGACEAAHVELLRQVEADRRGHR